MPLRGHCQPGRARGLPVPARPEATALGSSRQWSDAHLGSHVAGTRATSGGRAESEAVAGGRNRAIPQATLTRLAGAGSRRVERFAKRRWNRGRLRALVAGLPTELRPAARWVVDGSATPEEQALAERIEGLRAAMAATEARMSSFHSPVPGSFRTDAAGHALPGPQRKQSAAAHSRTGSRPRKGILLRRLTAGSGVARVLELGTNTGLSACWMGSSPGTRLVTVEGSADLCRIARDHIAEFSETFEVRNALFDDALDALAAEQPFDLAFVDGQHEGAATLHYHQRVLSLVRKEGAIIVHDDIYWSHDMRRAWLRIASSDGIRLSVDFGTVGVVITGDPGPAGPQLVDLPALMGRPHIPRRVGDTLT